MIGDYAPPRAEVHYPDSDGQPMAESDLHRDRMIYAKDEGAKRGIYAFLRIPEYFQLDPAGYYLDPPLQGQRLLSRNYQDIPATTLPDGTLVMPSEVLGLELRLNASMAEMRFYDAGRGQVLPSHAEQSSRVIEQGTALQAADAEIERLRAELARLRSESA